MYDDRKHNVNSFIGHPVVLQYVTFQRVEQILSAKTRLNANLTQWRHDYVNEYVTSHAATSLTKSCGKHYINILKDIFVFLIDWWLRQINKYIENFEYETTKSLIIANTLNMLSIYFFIALIFFNFS